jgi:hypothetical protein
MTRVGPRVPHARLRATDVVLFDNLDFIIARRETLGLYEGGLSAPGDPKSKVVLPQPSG